MEVSLKNIIKNNEIKNKKYIDMIEREKDDLITIIDSINSNILYKSKIHGYNHSNKVMLFAYLIGKDEKLNASDFKILIDAALYHDIGRTSDNEDTVHGLSSAYLIENYLTSDFYKDPENKNILKAIIDGHSRSDENKVSTSIDYEVKDYERYSKLYDILKDADALDRKRFREGFYYSFDEKYLRCKKSFELIELSEIINQIFKDELVNINPNIVKSETEEDCLHSIGFDFFKLNSIFENGILSKSEMKEKNLKIPANFDGGNLDNWISVVDGKLIPNNSSGMRNFINFGISFYCKTNYLEKGLDNGNEFVALESGLPYNKGLHEDEKYVYKNIPVEDILSILIPNNYKNKSILGLSYVYNSLDENLFRKRIMYFYNYIKDRGIDIDFYQIVEPLNEYCAFIKNYHALNEHERSMVNIKIVELLEPYISKINQIIGKWIYKYYFACLNKKYITVTDVLDYELSKSKLSYKKIDTSNELLVLIDQKKKNEIYQKK